MKRLFILLLLFAGTRASSPAQAISASINGSVGQGLYSGLYKNSESPVFSSIYTEAGLKTEVSNNLNFKSYAEVRYRYGSDFGSTTSAIAVREAWTSIYSRRMEFIIGQRIVKWGRADFDNPVSSLNPRNLIVRSPWAEDRDLGNICATLILKPASFVSVQAVIIPYYRSDVLIIRPLEIPESVTIEELPMLSGGRSMTGYGLKADFYLKSIDFSVSYFNGNDPLPGIRLKGLDVVAGDDGLELLTTLGIAPFRVSRVGFDFETTAGRMGIRGEAAWTKPELSFRENEFVPMPEIKWVLGLDIAAGAVNLGAEYLGKIITDFEEPPIKPQLPGEAPPLTPEEIGQIPGGPEALARMQITSFNRLYMYQLNRVNHSAGFRADSDFAAGSITASLSVLLSFTTREIALVPSIKYRPADGIILIAGADIFKGMEGSLYDITDKALTNVFFGIRVDF
jgi:hypothetical protein